MIDHKVTIGGENVSEDVVAIKVGQSNDVDSDPGKFTITLANRHQKYTTKWPPQVSEIEIILYNWVYRAGDENPSGRSRAEYLVATGKMTDNEAGPEQAIVTGECDLGHLADALDFESDIYFQTPKDVLAYFLGQHKPEPIEFDWDPALDDRNVFKERENYNSEWTYQSFLADICTKQLGAIFYFSEENRLQIKDPYTDVGTYDLDPYVLYPGQTTSMMGYRNAVVVIGDESKDKSHTAIGVHGSKPIISDREHGFDWESIEKIGWLMAPVFRDPNIKTIDEANAKADELLRFYAKYKNALTEVEVVGIVPPIQATVEYSPFIPISAKEQGEFVEALKDILAGLQAKENEIAALQERTSRNLTISSKVRGIVVEKEVSYSIDGLKCKCVISPGLVDGEPITDVEGVGSLLNWTEVIEENMY